MIRAVCDIGNTVSKGDIFEVVGTHIEWGGREYKVVQRLADRRRFRITVDDLQDDELFELAEISDEDVKNALDDALNGLIWRP